MYRIFAIFLLVVCSQSVFGQSYNKVNYISGCNTFSPNKVCVTGFGSAQLQINCGTSPFWLGQSFSGGFKFTFTHAVQYARMQFIFMHTGEVISFYINGTKYNISSQQVSPYASTCSSTKTSSVVNGDLVAPTGIPFNVYIPGGGAQVDIYYPGGIKEISVSQINGVGNGTGMSFFFGYDTVVIPHPNNSDTFYCSGEEMVVPFYVPNNFKSGNKFIAQLSDSTGSFSNPINIDTVVGTTSDTFRYVIPSTLPSGKHYKVRAVTTNPVKISDTNGFDLHIQKMPAKPIATATFPACIDAPLTFSIANYQSNAAYTWSGPNSFSLNKKDSTVNQATIYNSGTYILTSTIYECVDKDTIQVTVNPIPIIDTAGYNPPLCAGDTLKLSFSSSTSGVYYKWTGPGGYTSVQANPVVPNVPYAYKGKFVATALLGGCGNSDTIDVDIKPLPDSVNITANSPVCLGDSIKLNAGTTSSGVKFNWSGPASFSDTIQSPVIPVATLNNHGRYYVGMELNGCYTKDSTDVIIKVKPPTPTAGYNAPVCLGETLQLSATTVQGATYKWYGPGSFTATTQNVSFTNAQLSDTGTYSVVSIANGCESVPAPVKVNVNAHPFVVIFPAAGDTICDGESASFVALPNNAGGTPLYEWYVNTSFWGTGLNVAIPGVQQGDLVYCEMTEYTKCHVPFKDQSNTIAMNVLPWLTPSVSIAADKNAPITSGEYIKFTATANDAGNKPQYQWIRNGTNEIGANGAVWSASTLSNLDIVCVEVTSSYRCPQPATVKSNCIKVNVGTDVNDIGFTEGLELYPNPNKGSFTLQGYVRADKKVRVDIINAVGQLVYSDSVRVLNSRLRTDIQVDDLQSGVYMLRLNAVDGARVLKFIIQK